MTPAEVAAGKVITKGQKRSRVRLEGPRSQGSEAAKAASAALTSKVRYPFEAVVPNASTFGPLSVTAIWKLPSVSSCSRTIRIVSSTSTRNLRGLYEGSSGRHYVQRMVRMCMSQASKPCVLSPGRLGPPIQGRTVRQPAPELDALLAHVVGLSEGSAAGHGGRVCPSLVDVPVSEDGP